MTLHRKGRKFKSVNLKQILFVIVFLLTSLGQFIAPNARANPSMGLDMAVDFTDLEPGDVLTLTVFFNNTGANNSSIVWINVSVPTHMSYVWDDSFLELGSKTGDYNWTFPNVMFGNHSFNIQFLVLDSVSDGELMIFSSHLDYLDDFGQPMPPPPDAFASVTAHRPVMLLSKSAEAYKISPGQIFNYTISFQNVGSVNASIVLISELLPMSLVYVNDTASLIGGVKTGPLNWSFSNVTGSLSFNLIVQALSSLPDGTLVTNDVLLSYMNTNGIWFQDEFATNTTMLVKPDMTFQKTVDKSLASAGDTLDYTLNVTNTGQGSAKTVWINDTLPNETTYVSSSPICDSIVNNTCSWTLNDLMPGIYEFHIQASINASAQSGSKLTNIASLNYTNSIGVPQGNLSSNASTTIRGSYLSLVLAGGIATTTPNDIFVFDVQIWNHVLLPSQAAWLNITFPIDIQYISDNATDAGGTKTGDYLWEFRNIFPGNRSFRIVTRISSDTTDMQNLQIDLQLDHTNEIGMSLPGATDMITIRIQAPVVTSEIISNRRTFEEGEEIAFTIFLNNTGSDSAFRAWVNLSIPSSLQYLNDTSSLIGGTSPETLSFVFSDFTTGNRAFFLYLRYQGELEKAEDLEVWVFLNYTDSNGDFIGESAQGASCSIVVPSEEFPIWVVGIIILLACAISFAGAFSRESSKYALLLFFLPLYSRLRRKEILDHETRGMIRGYVIANPGDHFNSIKSALDLRNGTLAHHLNVLEREDIIKSVKDGKYRRFFPVGMRVADEVFPTKIEKIILDIVRETPGITQKEIAGHLGMSQPTVSYHIGKLRDSQRIRTEKHGMSLRHFIIESRK